jgi:cysteine/glycine-rich protein
MFGGAPACPKCTKSVYFAEQVLGPTGMWHKACLKCQDCKKSLNAGSFVTRGIEPYCNPCYTRQFGAQGPNFYSIVSPAPPPSAVSVSTFSGDEVVNGMVDVSETKDVQEAKEVKVPTPTETKFASLGRSQNVCGGCAKTVYAVELVSAAGRSWHKTCLRCKECNKTMKTNELTDSKDGIYCKNCYSRVHGPHGFRAGSTSVNLDAPR